MSDRTTPSRTDEVITLSGAAGCTDPAALVGQLVELIAAALAPKLAARLAPSQLSATETPSSRLVTLDQLIDQLPRGKKPETWKRWLYERTRRGQVPGCHKLGGTLFFDSEQTLPWIVNAGRPHAPADDWMSGDDDGTLSHVPNLTTDTEGED